MRWVALSLALLTLLPSAAADTDPADEAPLYSCAKAKKTIRVSFKPGVSLRELVSWAMGFSCRNFVYSDAVARRELKVEVIAPSAMSGRGAWRLFLTALRAMNLTVVDKGEALEIVEAPQAGNHALPIDRELGGGSGEQVRRALVHVEHADFAEMATALGAIKSTSGSITPLPHASMLLVTDFASHLSRMAEVVAAIDRPGAADKVWLVPVRHADVDALAATLEAIVGAAPAVPSTAPRASRRGKRPAAAPAAAPTRILTDPRTRSIIVVGSEPSYRRARALVHRLDVAVADEAAGEVHMIELEHADAKELADTMTALLSSRPQPAAQRQNGAAPSAPGGPLAVTGEVRVTHDAPTNSLLVLASMRDFLALREIVRRLDSTRRQVYIEATILELDTSGERHIGASAHVGQDHGDSGIWLAGLQHEDLASADVASVLGLSGLIGGVLGPSTGALDFLGQSIPSFGVLFQALATSRRANLISSPRLMTTDNAAAKIKIAESRRELGPAITTPGGVTTQTPESNDASLVLEVTPHVGAGDEVRLDIALTIESFLPPRQGAAGSDKSIREIENTVVVRDQESVIIGGLMVDRRVETESKVPLVGDLPLLGHLFKRSGTETEKTNLVILLTPYVLSGRADENRVVRRELARRAEFMRAHMALEAAEYRPDIDYRRKRGLLQAINERARAVEREREMLDSAAERGRPAVEEGPL